MTWLDALRVFAGIFIVALHASTDGFGQPFPGHEPLERAFPVLFRTITHIARSELFIIISLFLLCFRLDRRPDTTYFDMIAYQAARILPAFAFWVVFYAFFRLIKAHEFGYTPNIMAQISSPQSWLNYFLLGNVQYHMHFIPTLFGIILLYPCYRLAMRYPQLGLVILACLFAKHAIDAFLWSQLQTMPGFDHLLRLVKIVSYSGYGFVAFSICGLLKQRYDRELSRQLLGVTLILATLFLMLKLVGAYKVTITGKWQYDYVAGWWADFLMPACIFLAFMAMQHINWPQIFSRLARYTFGIYLLHPAVLDLVEIYIWPLSLSPSFQVLAKFVIGFPMTFVAVWVISKLRFTAWIVGLGTIPIWNRGKGAKLSPA